MRRNMVDPNIICSEFQLPTGIAVLPNPAHKFVPNFFRRRYFWNVSTGATTWDLPAGPPGAALAIAPEPASAPASESAPDQGVLEVANDRLPMEPNESVSSVDAAVAAVATATPRNDRLPMEPDESMSFGDAAVAAVTPRRSSGKRRRSRSPPARRGGKQSRSPSPPTPSPPAPSSRRSPLDEGMVLEIPDVKVNMLHMSLSRWIHEHGAHFANIFASAIHVALDILTQRSRVEYTAGSAVGLLTVRYNLAHSTGKIPALRRGELFVVGFGCGKATDKLSGTYPIRLVSRGAPPSPRRARTDRSRSPRGERLLLEVPDIPLARLDFTSSRSHASKVVARVLHDRLGVYTSKDGRGVRLVDTAERGVVTAQFEIALPHDLHGMSSGRRKQALTSLGQLGRGAALDVKLRCADRSQIVRPIRLARRGASPAPRHRAPDDAADTTMRSPGLSLEVADLPIAQIGGSRNHVRDVIAVKLYKELGINTGNDGREVELIDSDRPGVVTARYKLHASQSFRKGRRVENLHRLKHGATFEMMLNCRGKCNNEHDRTLMREIKLVGTGQSPAQRENARLPSPEAKRPRSDAVEDRHRRHRRRHRHELEQLGNVPALSEADVGARVKVAGYGTGTLRFFGMHRTKILPRCGVELDTPTGLNDGTVAGQYYFDSPAKHGVLVDPSKVKRNLASKIAAASTTTSTPSTSPALAMDAAAEGAGGEAAAAAAEPSRFAHVTVTSRSPASAVVRWFVADRWIYVGIDGAAKTTATPSGGRPPLPEIGALVTVWAIYMEQKEETAGMPGCALPEHTVARRNCAWQAVSVEPYLVA